MNDELIIQTPRKSRRDVKKSPGRPPLYDSPMKLVNILLPTAMIEWLQNRDTEMSSYVRDLIQREMAKEAETANTPQE